MFQRKLEDRYKFENVYKNMKGLVGIIWEMSKEGRNVQTSNIFRKTSPLT